MNCYRNEKGELMIGRTRDENVIIAASYSSDAARELDKGQTQTAKNSLMAALRYLEQALSMEETDDV